MSEREYDILLAETAGSLPPGPSEQSEPWRVAMRRILWGLALVTIKLELLGLNYLLPCLGAALVYLEMCIRDRFGVVHLGKFSH